MAFKDVYCILLIDFVITNKASSWENYLRNWRLYGNKVAYPYG